MTREEANIEAKKIYEEWKTKKEQIIKKAKEDGTWCKYGLDSNNHLLKELHEETKEKLKKLALLIDED